MRSRISTPSSLRTLLVATVLVSGGCGDTGPATAEIPPFALQDDASYQRLLEAGIAAEILRFELSRENRPRIAASAALLMAYAERNRTASEEQLLAYMDAVESTLSQAYAEDPYLSRPPHFLPALRFVAERANAPELEGTDTRVGDDALALLNLSLSTSTRSLRAVDFERAQSVEFANYSPLASLVTSLMLDTKPSGRGHRGLAAAMRALGQANGIDLAPADLLGTYPEVARARDDLPPDFAAYQAERDASFSNVRASIGDEAWPRAEPHRPIALRDLERAANRCRSVLGIPIDA